MNMKRFLLLLIILTGKSYESRSQSIDTLCFDRTTVQKLLIAGKQKKVLDSLVISLNQEIKSYEIVVHQLQDKDSVNKEIIITYDAMIQTMKEQRTILETQITALNKEVRKWKRKTRWTAIAGVATTVAGVIATIFILR
jgi:hypothetical protein